MKYIIGFFVGAGLALGGYALGATQSTGAVRIWCNTDGTMSVDTVPRP